MRGTDIDLNLCSSTPPIPHHDYFFLCYHDYSKLLLMLLHLSGGVSGQASEGAPEAVG
jgi:hypothetical protein